MITDIAILLVVAVFCVIMIMFAVEAWFDIRSEWRERSQRLDQAADDERQRRQRVLDRLHEAEETAILHLEDVLAADAAGDTFLTVSDREAAEKLVAEWRQDHPKENPPS